MTHTPSTTPGSDAAGVTVTSHAATSLVELLECCDEFLRTASPTVRAELRAFLAGQPTRPDAGWLIDMLGFNALYLQGKLALTHATIRTTGHPDQAGR